jgi:hypothetical protein
MAASLRRGDPTLTREQRRLGLGPGSAACAQSRLIARTEISSPRTSPRHVHWPGWRLFGAPRNQHCRTQIRYRECFAPGPASPMQSTPHDRNRIATTSSDSFFAGSTVVDLRSRRGWWCRGRRGRVRRSRWLDCLRWGRSALTRRRAGCGSRARLQRRFAGWRWWRNTLAEVRILHFAICYELRVDLWQRLASTAPLRRSSHDRNDTIYKKAIAGFGIPPHKSRLLAGCHDLGTSRLTRRRLHRATRDQINEKHTEDGAISVHLYLHVSARGTH